MDLSSKDVTSTPSPQPQRPTHKVECGMRPRPAAAVASSSPAWMANAECPVQGRVSAPSGVEHATRQGKGLTMEARAGGLLEQRGGADAILHLPSPSSRAVRARGDRTDEGLRGPHGWEKMDRGFGGRTAISAVRQAAASAAVATYLGKGMWSTSLRPEERQGGEDTVNKLSWTAARRELDTLMVHATQ